MTNNSSLPALLLFYFIISSSSNGDGYQQCLLGGSLRSAGDQGQGLVKEVGIPESPIDIFVVVQSLSCAQLLANLWTAAGQASLSFTISLNLLKLISTVLVMPSNCLILCPASSPPDLNLSQHRGLFHWVGSSHQVTKVLELQHQHQSFQRMFRVDFL